MHNKPDLSVYWQCVWGVELLRSPTNSSLMLQLAASLVLTKGIIWCTDAFLSSGQGAGTKVAFLKWDVINGLGENSALGIIVLHCPAFSVQLHWGEYYVPVAPLRNRVTPAIWSAGHFFSSLLRNGPVSDSVNWASQRFLCGTGEQVGTYRFSSVTSRG